MNSGNVFGAATKLADADEIAFLKGGNQFAGAFPVSLRHSDKPIDREPSVASVGLESALGLIGCKGRGVFLLSGRAHSDKWARVN